MKKGVNRVSHIVNTFLLQSVTVALTNKLHLEERVLMEQSNEEQLEQNEEQPRYGNEDQLEQNEGFHSEQAASTSSAEEGDSLDLNVPDGARHKASEALEAFGRGEYVSLSSAAKAYGINPQYLYNYRSFQRRVKSQKERRESRELHEKERATMRPLRASRPAQVTQFVMKTEEIKSNPTAETTPSNSVKEVSVVMVKGDSDSIKRITDFMGKLMGIN